MCASEIIVYINRDQNIWDPATSSLAPEANNNDLRYRCALSLSLAHAHKMARAAHTQSRAWMNETETQKYFYCSILFSNQSFFKLWISQQQQQKDTVEPMNGSRRRRV